MTLSPHILATIGNTPLIELRKIVRPGGACILAKLEGANPTGSMKERMALSMIEAARKDGRLKPGGKVVEFTGGSTGTSLAMVCAVKGHPLSIVTSNAASLEKRNHMQALGAQMTVLHTEGGKLNPNLFKRMKETTQNLVAETGAFWTDQFNNPDQATGYGSLAEEIWEQTGGRVDVFVHVVGTCGSLRGVSSTLRQRDSSVQVVAVEPEESPVLSGGKAGSHRIEGVGTGTIPPLWDRSLVDAIERVSVAEAEEMARRLAREEGLFVGTSSGANVVEAIRMAGTLGPNKTVVTILVDNGLKYLSTALFN